MSRELLILRHAKSSWDDPELDDFDRPLNGRGERDADRMGRYLVDADLVPELVISSPARRAGQTAKRACCQMGLPPNRIDFRQNLYHAGTGDLCRVVSQCPGKVARLMLVGHNPGLEDFVAWLADRPTALPADGKLLPTAALARLTLTAPWRDLSRHAAPSKRQNFR